MAINPQVQIILDRRAKILENLNETCRDIGLAMILEGPKEAARCYERIKTIVQANLDYLERTQDIFYEHERRVRFAVEMPVERQQICLETIHEHGPE